MQRFGGRPVSMSRSRRAMAPCLVGRRGPCPLLHGVSWQGQPHSPGNRSLAAARGPPDGQSRRGRDATRGVYDHDAALPPARRGADHLPCISMRGPPVPREVSRGTAADDGAIRHRPQCARPCDQQATPRPLARPNWSRVAGNVRILPARYPLWRTGTRSWGSWNRPGAQRSSRAWQRQVSGGASAASISEDVALYLVHNAWHVCA